MSSQSALPTICFVFQYRGVGGVPILFFRVAKFLVEQNLARPFLVDYEDGMMARLINDDMQRVTLVPYSDDAVTCLPEDAIVVFQSMTPWSIFPNLNVAKEAKIFFWNCHPFNLVTFFPGFRFLAYKFPCHSLHGRGKLGKHKRPQ